MPKVPKTTSLQYLCNISRKKGGMKLIFYIEINKPFYKLMLSILLSIAIHAQSTLKDEVDFCTDKHQSIKKVGTIIFDGCSQACLKYSK